MQDTLDCTIEAAIKAYGLRCVKAGVESAMDRFIEVIQAGNEPLLIDLAHTRSELIAVLAKVQQ